MRISGGNARGIPLLAPKGDAVRPATDGLRQAVFSSLAARVPGAWFVDLFAGSGAYGLEALSRGAAGGTWVERDRRAADCLRANLAAVCKSLGRDPRDAALHIAQRDALTWTPATPLGGSANSARDAAAGAENASDSAAGARGASVAAGAGAGPSAGVRVNARTCVSEVLVFVDPPYEIIRDVAPKVFGRVTEWTAHLADPVLAFETPGEIGLAPVATAAGWTEVHRVGGTAPRQPGVSFFRRNRAVAAPSGNSA